jgi:putative endopeptidase
MKSLLLSSTAALLLVACSDPQTTAGGADELNAGDTQAVQTDVALAAATFGDWGVDTSLLSTTVEPGDDFFRYVNEGWLASESIPDGFSSNGVFLELYLESERRIGDIITDMTAEGGAPGEPGQQIGDLHASFMDAATIEAAGLDPIRGEIDGLASLADFDAVVDAMTWTSTPAFVGPYINVDGDNPDQYVLRLTQGGLGLPGRDYYLRDDGDFPEFQEAYRAYIGQIFDLSGMDAGEDRAARIYALEAAMAEIHWTPADASDSLLINNRFQRAELEAYAPDMPWHIFLGGLGVSDVSEVMIDEDTAIAAMVELWRDTPIETLRDYMVFHYIDNHTTYLPAAFDEASFAFYGTTLQGVESQRARELRAVQLVNGNLGEVLGQVYVERHFPPEYKAQMEELVGYLQAALRERINDIDWMDDETRVEALRKLDSFGLKIGYPDVWRDFSSLEIRGDDLIGNMHRIAEWNWADSRSRLGGPVRDWEWGMNPQTVNAYYSPTRNEIVFPAAILQPPFFDPIADAAVNFGSIGGVIGHEIGHGFDDDGSRYNADGYLSNWWTNASREAFEAQTDVLVDQYNGFEPMEGIFVNGDLTLGENIGDVGGLSMALHAYRMYARDHGTEGEVLDGFTPEQRFFMSWAQSWRHMATDGYMRSLVLTDPHSPAQYRVNGVVRNLDDWYEAFGVTEDDELYLPPERRVTVW